MLRLSSSVIVFLVARSNFVSVFVVVWLDFVLVNVLNFLLLGWSSSFDLFQRRWNLIAVWYWGNSGSSPSCCSLTTSWHSVFSDVYTLLAGDDICWGLDDFCFMPQCGGVLARRRLVLGIYCLDFQTGSIQGRQIRAHSIRVVVVGLSGASWRDSPSVCR